MAKIRPSGQENPRPTKKTKPELPYHFIFDAILPRLPTKSLVRFRSVCKSWDSFIRDPSFVQLRRSAGNIHGHLIFVTVDLLAAGMAIWDPHILSVPIHRNNEESEVTYSSPANPTHILGLPNFCFASFGVQSVNGFLCFHHENGGFHCTCSHGTFTQIFNPTTCQLITLPLDDVFSFPLEGALATHFGFDPLRDEFKVLRFYKHSSVYEFKILTIGSDAGWRLIEPEIPLNPVECDFIASERGFYFNGAIHWMHGIDKIVAFDVAEEEFRIIPIYKEHTRLINYHKLVEVDGCLSVIGYNVQKNPELLWVLKDYKANLWIEECIIGLPNEIKSRKRMVLPLCEVGNNNIIMLLPYIGHQLEKNCWEQCDHGILSTVMA